MLKKVLFIILMIIFVISLIFISQTLKKESEKKLASSNEQVEYQNEENKTNILNVTSENFESEVLQSDKTVLIDFYADWCGPCKILSPIVEEVAKENADVKVVKINVDSEQEIAIKYRIMSIPTLVVIKEGKEINRAIGIIEKSEILTLLNMEENF